MNYKNDLDECPTYFKLLLEFVQFYIIIILWVA
jgi:hypothetical protein